MASATRKTVEKTITEDVIVLELTKDEASWLFNFIDEDNPHAVAIVHALHQPAETDDRPIRVGDKVRITVPGVGNSVYLNEVGKVDKLDMDDTDFPYLVILPDRDYVWVESVERVND